MADAPSFGPSSLLAQVLLAHVKAPSSCRQGLRYYSATQQVPRGGWWAGVEGVGQVGGGVWGGGGGNCKACSAPAGHTSHCCAIAGVGISQETCCVVIPTDNNIQQTA
jgi:hypothetical protein